MHTIFLKIAAILGGLAVAAGAFGAHSLKQVLSDKDLAIFETAVRYQFYHVVALLALGILFKEFPNNYMLWSGRLFCFGVLIFSGSLYAMTILEAMGRHGFRWLGAITPIGGLCLIAGWVMLAIGLTSKG